MSPLLAVFLVFAGCCSNVMFLELIIKEVPSSGMLVTFSQFLIISLEGFIFTSKFGQVKPVVPLKKYAIIVCVFFFVSIINNYVWNFNISMPLHMIFRAGSLIANMILGMIILHYRYKRAKYLAVLMISVGIAMCTIASGKQVQQKQASAEENWNHFMWWLLGVSLMFVNLFLAARLGIFQEQIYKQHGKHPRESLFYTHVMPLPAFLFFAKDIYKHIFIFSQAEPIILPLIGLGVPKLWLYLIANVITQYIGIRSVYFLTTECKSLTINLVIALRKFISLLISIFYFHNAFTMYHWIGTASVFIGTLLFSDVHTKVWQLIHPPPPEKKTD